MSDLVEQLREWAEPFEAERNGPDSLDALLLEAADTIATLKADLARREWKDADSPEKSSGLVVLMDGKMDDMTCLEVGFWDSELGWVDGDGEPVPFNVIRYLNVGALIAAEAAASD